MKDLLKLYTFYSVGHTEGEKQICDYLQQWFTDNGTTVERYGNTLIHMVSAELPLLSAHLDMVDTNGPAVHFYGNDGIITGYNEYYQQTSLGADDKNGVWIIMKAVEAGLEFNFVISECEECGGDGIRKVEDKLIGSYAVVMDRKGNTDILEKGCSTQYCKTLAWNLKNFWDNGYTVTTGGMSDTQTICKHIESVNISVAYNNPHTENEETDFDRLDEIKDDVIRMLTDFVHYPCKPEGYTTTYNYTKREKRYDDNYWKKLYSYEDDETYWPIR